MKATVLLVTYNHAPYIEQALDSVLGQVAGFPWEIVISEDCSTDGTRAIVEQYARRHPDRIRLLLSERNRNDNEVIARGLRAAAGEFVAYLDGDDWWRVPHKLATQVRFLEQNPSCVMCYHSVLRVHEDGSRPPSPSLPPGPRPPMTLEDVLARYCINSCSVAFRRSAVPELPDWYYSADLADWALSVLLSTRGAVGYVDEVMAAYRIHARGVWSGVTHRQRIEARLAFFDRLGADFRRRHAGAVRAGRGQAHLDLALAWEAEGRSVQAASHALQSLWQSPGRPVSLPRRAPPGARPPAPSGPAAQNGRAGRARDMTTPAVSVVIPTYQRRESVQRAIEALAGQTLAPDAYEVVVSIDGSDDGTREMLEALRVGFPLRSLWHPNRGRAAARNAGVDAARGSLVLFLDDDMVATPGLLAAHLEAHTSSHGHPAKRAVIGSAPIVTSPPSPLTLYLAARFQERLDTLARPGRAPRFNEAYTGNLSLARATLLEVGGFDESFQAYGHEDYEFALRLIKAGGELRFSPAAVAYQHQSKDFPALARDAMARGSTAVLFARKHPEVAGDLKTGLVRRGHPQVATPEERDAGDDPGVPRPARCGDLARDGAGAAPPATAGPVLHDGARLLLLGRRTDGAPRSASRCRAG